MAKVAVLKKKDEPAKKVLRLPALKKERKAIDKANPVEAGTVLTLPDESVELFAQHRIYSAQAKAANIQLEYIRVQLAEMCGTYEVGQFPHGEGEVYRGLTAVKKTVIPARNQRECKIRDASSVEEEGDE